jgi:6-phosphogluconolactonase (cycloisomerase 2 family)
MKALITVTSLFFIVLLSGCLGSNNSSIAPTLAFMYAVGPGSNAINGFTETSIGDVQSLTVPSFATNPRPVSIALHPSKNFLYVPNLTSNTVSGFNIDHTTGVLSPIGTAQPPTPVQSQPVAVGVNSTGGFLYVLNQGSASISAFSIDSARGLLTEIAGSPFPTAVNPQSMVLSPTTGFLYVGNGTLGTISGFAIATNGTLAQLAGSPFSTEAGATLAGLTIDPKGQFLFAADSANNAIASFNIAASGVLTAVAGSPFAAGTSPLTTAVDVNSAFLYAANNVSGNVSAFTITAGALTPVAGSPFALVAAGTVSAPQPVFLTVDPSNTFLYVGNAVTNNISVFGIKKSDGTLGLVTDSPFTEIFTPQWIVITE